MIRKPISPAWRIGLGGAAILLMGLLYSVLAGTRQAAARREQQDVAETRLAELAELGSQLEQERAAAEQMTDPEQRRQALERLGERQKSRGEQVAKFTEARDNPDKVDLTVPSWAMLYERGLIRACTSQGAFQRKEIWIVEDFTATGSRLVSALLLGTLISVLLGLLMGCFAPLDAFCTPPFAFLSKIPATAVLPIFFVVIQINFSMYIAIIVFGMLPSLAQSVSASVRKDVPDELIFKAYTLGASQLELIWEVIFKQVLPRTLDAIRLQIGPALVLLVAAEWMVAGEGVGYRLRLFYQRTDMTVVFVYVLILGLLGLAVDYGLIRLRRQLCPWFGD